MTWNPDHFHLACTATVLIVGMVTCVGMQSRLRRATLPLAGLFLLAADGRLFWASRGTLQMIERSGHAETLGNQPWLGVWYYGWHLLPLLLAAFFAWQLWKRLRRMAPVANEPARPVA